MIFNSILNKKKQSAIRYIKEIIRTIWIGDMDYTIVLYQCYFSMILKFLLWLCRGMFSFLENNTEMFGGKGAWGL